MTSVVSTIYKGEEKSMLLIKLTIIYNNKFEMLPVQFILQGTIPVFHNDMVFFLQQNNESL